MPSEAAAAVASSGEMLPLLLSPSVSSTTMRDSGSSSRSRLAAVASALQRLPAAHLASRPAAARRARAAVCAEDEPPPDLTKVGSRAYYEGFLTQPVDDESVTTERGDGTEQALKFAASSAGVVAVLFFGFMASNGLLG